MHIIDTYVFVCVPYEYKYEFCCRYLIIGRFVPHCPGGYLINFSNKLLDRI